MRIIIFIISFSILYSCDECSLKTEYRSDGSKISVGSYCNEKKEGLFFFYDIYGNKIKESYYLNNKLEGVTILWKNDTFIDRQIYYTGNKIKKIIDFGLDGKISYYKIFTNDSDFVQIDWESNKKKYVYYKDYQMDGKVYIWYENGNIYCEGQYSRVGKTNNVEESKQFGIVYSAIIKRGLKCGKWVYYYPNGRILKIENYDKNGNLINKIN